MSEQELLQQKIADLRTDFRRNERAEKKLAKEICEFLTGKCFEVRKPNNCDYVRVKSAKQGRYSTVEADADFVKFEFADDNSLVCVSRDNTFNYFRHLSAGDFFDGFREITDDEFEAKYAVWTQLEEKVNAVIKGQDN